MEISNIKKRKRLDRVEIIRLLLLDEMYRMEALVRMAYYDDLLDISDRRNMVGIISQFVEKPQKKRGKNSIRDGSLWLEWNLPHNNSFWVSTFACHKCCANWYF